MGKAFFNVLLVRSNFLKESEFLGYNNNRDLKGGLYKTESEIRESDHVPLGKPLDFVNSAADRG